MRARDPGRGRATAVDRPRGPARTPRHNPRCGPCQARAPGWRSAWRRPHCRKTPPHGSARFEQGGPLATTRALRDLDGDRRQSSRLLQSAGASQGERLQVRNEVDQPRALLRDRARLSEFLLVTLQEGDGIGNQAQVGGLQLTLRRPSDRQQRIVKAIFSMVASDSPTRVRKRVANLVSSVLLLPGRLRLFVGEDVAGRAMLRAQAERRT